MLFMSDANRGLLTYEQMSHQLVSPGNVHRTFAGSICSMGYTRFDVLVIIMSFKEQQECVGKRHLSHRILLVNKKKAKNSIFLVNLGAIIMVWQRAALPLLVA